MLPQTLRSGATDAHSVGVAKEQGLQLTGDPVSVSTVNSLWLSARVVKP